MSRRVAFMSDDTESVSMGDMVNEDELGQLPMQSQSRHERMHEQYNNFQDEDDQWQSELARWKNRRRCASQDLIKKEEERKRMEKRMKEEERDSNKRKSIKTYKEIVEEKERREAELCDAYRNAATPEEAAMVLQRYALRFTISDATLDYLKLPRSTTKPKAENQMEKEHKAAHDSETLDPLHEPESAAIEDQKHIKSEDMETGAQQETSATASPTTLMPTTSVTHSPQSQELCELKPQPEPSSTHKQSTTIEAQPQSKHSLPHVAHVQPQPTKSVDVLPSPPSGSSRPVPLLAAKPYCQPKNSHVKVDGLVRVNGETASTPLTLLLHSPEEKKDVPLTETEKEVPSKQTVVVLETSEQSPPTPQTEKSASSSGSTISSLFGGRNCIITTTIVTELTQTLVEPLPLDDKSSVQVNGRVGLSETSAEEENIPPPTSPSSMQDYSPIVTEGLEESSVTIETPMLNLAKRVNHWVWDPNEERKRLESWQQEQERLLQEQYLKEQEKLKKEWEKAQLEVAEEERKHNEEERRILEETVTPLNASGLVNQQSGQTGATSPAVQNNNPEVQNTTLQQNGQRISRGNEDQHATKLHFLQDFPCGDEMSKRQELWKTASLDRNTQLNQALVVKRSGSHDSVTGKQQSSSSSPDPPSPSRCVSGKRLCSGCSEPLGKGAAMIIDTLGLFFHMQCFKCGMCKGQLGDATAGTDVRIRNGLLSCHDCYIASRGRGQPTTL